MSLDDHLHACMRETVGRAGGAVGARRDLAIAVQRDPALASEAEARLAALAPAVTDKCFIARTQAAALREALNRG